jgi:hypothetical protein
VCLSWRSIKYPSSSFCPLTSLSQHYHRYRRSWLTFHHSAQQLPMDRFTRGGATLSSLLSSLKIFTNSDLVRYVTEYM